MPQPAGPADDERVTNRNRASRIRVTHNSSHRAARPDSHRAGKVWAIPSTGLIEATCREPGPCPDLASIPFTAPRSAPAAPTPSSASVIDAGLTPRQEGHGRGRPLHPDRRLAPARRARRARGSGCNGRSRQRKARFSDGGQARTCAVREVRHWDLRHPASGVAGRWPRVPPARLAGACCPRRATARAPIRSRAPPARVSPSQSPNGALRSVRARADACPGGPVAQREQREGQSGVGVGAGAGGDLSEVLGADPERE